VKKKTRKFQKWIFANKATGQDCKFVLYLVSIEDFISRIPRPIIIKQHVTLSVLQK